jgi:hypothetical protein
MINPLIFLDHDGVMCLFDEQGGRFKKWRKKPGAECMFRDGRMVVNTGKIKTLPIEIRFDNFNLKAVKVLNRILRETNANIVVTSDWRHHATLEDLQQLYKAYGIIKQPIGVTGFAKDLPNGHDLTHSPDSMRLEICRCAEIRKWLSENEHDKWVVVDDLDLGIDTWPKFGLSHFVQTPRMLEGIKQSGIADKIINTLK